MFHELRSPAAPLKGSRAFVEQVNSQTKGLLVEVPFF
jgi:hypothetical protein